MPDPAVVLKMPDRCAMGTVIAIRPRRRLRNLALAITRKQAIEASIRALEKYQRLSARRQSLEDAGRFPELCEILQFRQLPGTVAEPVDINSHSPQHRYI
jgi:hypothetical protein